MTRIPTYILLTLGLVCPVCAEDAPLPEKGQKLRDSYRAAVDRAITPLTKTYLAELQRLKIEYTKAADLKGALAIENEINLLSPGSTADPTNAPKLKSRDARTVKELEVKQIGTKFYSVYIPGSVFESFQHAEKAAQALGGRVASVSTAEIGQALNTLHTKELNIFVYAVDTATGTEKPRIRFYGGRLVEPTELLSKTAKGVVIEFDSNPHTTAK